MVGAAVTANRHVRTRHARHAKKSRTITRIFELMIAAILRAALSMKLKINDLAETLKKVPSLVPDFVGDAIRAWKHEAKKSAVLLLDSIALLYDTYRMRQRRYVLRRHRRFIHDIIKSFRLLMLSFATIVFGGYTVYQTVIIVLPESIQLLLYRMSQMHTMDVRGYEVPWSQAAIVGMFGLLLLFIVASAKVAIPGFGREVVYATKEMPYAIRNMNTWFRWFRSESMKVFASQRDN